MNSIGEDCNELKTKYDTCFNHWFSEKFLRGSTDDSACKELFKMYQKCVQDALHVHQIDIKDLKHNHIDGTEFENSKTEDKPKVEAQSNDTS